ncbi:MAG: homogentisate 1,2-dioxygenase [Pseudomonadota bacterium]|nr:homogentisate 1,2-dioxygenase [Pseudomonadota bacterium]
MPEEPGYQSGFGNEFATEAVPGALPPRGNSPQRCPYGLYAEQFSGTAFTAPRHANRRSWLYRIRPAVTHRSFQPFEHARFDDAAADAPLSPNQFRWDPLPLPKTPTDFVEGLLPIAGNGSPESQSGCAIYLYAANQSMRRRFFYDADGEMLIVPQTGTLTLDTELGRIVVAPQEIAVVPRGLRFCVEVPPGGARGYICENFGALFRLPDLGPIGSNGLANARDFQIPRARYEDIDAECELIAKFSSRLWAAKMDHSPLDVVAWRGNYAPYKYDLRRFNTMGSVSYDHPDPSIFLVLHSPSDTAGTSNIDFVVFPPRWLVMQDTFRPPWFHRNVANEFMGLICGVYDAKSEGFVPGGSSLHNCMSGHGPDAATFEHASSIDTSLPLRIGDSMAFMFETRMPIKPTRVALAGIPALQNDYISFWLDLKKYFDPTRP